MALRVRRPIASPKRSVRRCSPHVQVDLRHCVGACVGTARGGRGACLGRPASPCGPRAAGTGAPHALFDVLKDAFHASLRNHGGDGFQMLPMTSLLQEGEEPNARPRRKVLLDNRPLGPKMTLDLALAGPHAHPCLYLSADCENNG